jgi:hypothetical protein
MLIGGTVYEMAPVALRRAIVFVAEVVDLMVRHADLRVLLQTGEHPPRTRPGRPGDEKVGTLIHGMELSV